MASLKKHLVSNSKKSLQHQLNVLLVDVFLAQKLVNPKLVVGFSGGLDSTVLLHLLSETKNMLPLQLHAHHVHHGLSKNADLWAGLCADFCKKLNIPFILSTVNINKNSGLGVEATAREARYNALLATDADFVCLAHHQDDQAETLLLQLVRGAGVKGLAGMPKYQGRLLRPLLDVPRGTLETYAKQHNLAWTEDESNFDTKFDRNFLRHEVLPALAKQYPAIKRTISRAAQNMAEADILLGELAEMDVKSCQLNQMDSKQIALRALADLSTSRVKNALRWWLQQHACDIPSAAQLQQIMQQLFHANADANVKIKVSAGLILRRYQDNAYLVENLQEAEDVFQRGAFSLTWQGEKSIVLPDQSHLFFSEKMGAGLAMRNLENMQLTIRYRQGGEMLRPEENRPNRSLKNLFQTSNIPPWQRERLPLLFLNDVLAVLPNSVTDVQFKAKPDELGLFVTWQNS